jgi:thioredoxin 1
MSTAIIITLAAIGFFAAYLFISYRRMKNIPEVAKNEKIKDLTDKNFQHQLKNRISLVDFWASWCMPCKMMAPVLNELADEVGPGVQICKVNVEQYQSIASGFAIRGIPTMILFRDGKEISRFVGVKSKDFLLEQINKIG